MLAINCYSLLFSSHSCCNTWEVVKHICLQKRSASPAFPKPAALTGDVIEEVIFDGRTE